MTEPNGYYIRITTDADTHRGTIPYSENLQGGTSIISSFYAVFLKISLVLQAS